MCEFCKVIALNDEEFGIMRQDKEEFIFFDDNKFNIFADTGDSFCPGIVNNIAYCPMCGRDLRSEENERTSKPS